MFRYDLLKLTKSLANLLSRDEQCDLEPLDRIAKAREQAHDLHDAIGREQVEEDCDFHGDIRNIHNLMTDAQFRRGKPVYHSPFHRPEASKDADLLNPQPTTAP